MGAKVLFSEITALSNKKGYCYATNGYFAKLYEVSKTTVSLWVKALIDRGHIKAQYKGGLRMLYVPEQRNLTKKEIKEKLASPSEIREVIGEALGVLKNTTTVS
jgi:transposase